MSLVDTHCHLDMLEDVEVVLARAKEAGVDRVVTIGVDAASSEWAARTAQRYPGVFASVGLHPHDAKDATAEFYARLEELAADERVVGIGETGLDYYYDNSPREQQRAAFAEHVRLAARVDKTVVVHSRDAWEDTFSILEQEGPPSRFVFHCFSGGPAEAERALALGAVLSFSGIVTFRNADELRAAVAVTPMDRLVVETDAPFLTPVPYRGQRNEPAFVAHVSEMIALVKGADLAEVVTATSTTAQNLFTLS